MAFCGIVFGLTESMVQCCNYNFRLRIVIVNWWELPRLFNEDANRPLAKKDRGFISGVNSGKSARGKRRLSQGRTGAISHLHDRRKTAVKMFRISRHVSQFFFLFYSDYDRDTSFFFVLFVIVD